MTLGYSKVRKGLRGVEYQGKGKLKAFCEWKRGEISNSINN